MQEINEYANVHGAVRASDGRSERSILFVSALHLADRNVRNTITLNEPDAEAPVVPSSIAVC